jgi:hypothetical protein
VVCNCNGRSRLELSHSANNLRASALPKTPISSICPGPAYASNQQNNPFYPWVELGHRELVFFVISIRSWDIILSASQLFSLVQASHHVGPCLGPFHLSDFVLRVARTGSLGKGVSGGNPPSRFGSAYPSFQHSFITTFSASHTKNLEISRYPVYRSNISSTSVSTCSSKSSS